MLLILVWNVSPVRVQVAHRTQGRKLVHKNFLMATSLLSVFKRRKTKSKSLKLSPNNVLCGESSPAQQLTSNAGLKSPPPGTIFTFNFFNAMENPLSHRKNADNLVEPGTPKLLLPIVVILAEQDQTSEGNATTSWLWKNIKDHAGQEEHWETKKGRTVLITLQWAKSLLLIANFVDKRQKYVMNLRRKERLTYCKFSWQTSQMFPNSVN